MKEVSPGLKVSGPNMKPTLRELVESDWAVLKSIRLESLTRHPDLFQPTRDEFAFTDMDWRERLTATRGRTFGLFSGTDPIGISTIVREGNQSRATRALLVGSYIRPEHRRKGFSRLFYDARIAWAREQGDIGTLVVEAREDNIASHSAHQHFGFYFVRDKEIIFGDGRAFRSLIFQLDLPLDEGPQGKV